MYYVIHEDRHCDAELFGFFFSKEQAIEYIWDFERLDVRNRVGKSEFTRLEMCALESRWSDLFSSIQYLEGFGDGYSYTISIISKDLRIQFKNLIKDYDD